LNDPLCGQYLHAVNWKRLNLTRWRTGLIGAALAAVAGLAFLVSPLGSGLTVLSYDSLFFFRSNVSVGDDVVILYMDLESDTRLGQKRRGTWDRALHARLLDRLRDYGPRVVAFDSHFVASEDEPAGDEALVTAAKASSNIVVAVRPVVEVEEGVVVTTQTRPPFPRLEEVVSWGVAEAAEPDGAIRRHHYLEDLHAPSMAWRVAEKTMSEPPPPFQPRWINYYGPPGFLRHFSYYEVFETNAPSLGALSNKVIFVGGLFDATYAGGKRGDVHRIPHTRWTGRHSPGVEICATAYLNLFRGDWLRRLSPWAEVCLVLLVAGACGILLATRRPVAAVGWALLGFLLVGAVAVWMTWQHLVWFPWLIVGAVQIPIAAGWSVLAYTKQLYHEKHAVEQALAMAMQGEEGASKGVAPAGPQPAPMYARAGSFSPLVTPTPGASPWATLPDDRTVPIVADHELLRCIGKGAYGEVWLARDVIGTYHAVKIVHQHSRHDPAPLEREFNGIKNFTPLSRSHPGFVHILQVGRNETAGYIYCVMELGDDETTGQKINPDTYSAKNLAREFKKRGRLPLAECLILGIQLAEALEHLHRNKLIHRDIKPSNIIFVDGAPKFADIGLVTAVAGEDREPTVVGTPGRMAPEGPGKPSADVYGLGKVLYEAGFGLDISRFPELPTDVIQTADESALFDFNRIIMKACEIDENRRYRTADALRADLAKLLKRMKSSGDSTI
jgi:CHASE2 domain-containing sensor protein